MNNRNLTTHIGRVAREERERVLGQRGCVIWFTGLSGSGKSTLASALEERLVTDGYAAYVLDGDNVRQGLNADLGFTAADRDENIRRIGEVAALFADAGLIAIAAFISPYREGREAARRVVGDNRFVEIYLDTPLAVCEQRDPKGLYARARAGEISNFTGIDAPYEEPNRPELDLPTDNRPVPDCIDTIMQCLKSRGLLQGE